MGPTITHREQMLIGQVQQFAEDDRTCRHVAICRYFGEVIDARNEEVLEAYCNKMCDVREFSFSFGISSKLTGRSVVIQEQSVGALSR